MIRASILVCALWLSGTALALEVGGVTLPDKATVGGQELVLNGAGIRTRIVLKVYVAALYLSQKAGTREAVLAKAPRRIQLTLLRNLSAEQFVDALNEGLRDNSSPAELSAVQTQADQLTAIIKAFKEARENDVVTLDFIDGVTQVGFKGEARGTIQGEAFNQALTRIWLGDKPVQADLKKALLGG